MPISRNNDLVAVLRLENIVEGRGYSNRVLLPPGASVESKLNPAVLLIENGLVIGEWANELRRVETVGAGLFHIDGNELYFSTKDNSNPVENGKTYELLLLPNVLTKVFASADPTHNQRYQELLSSCIPNSRPVAWSNELVSSFWSDISNSPMSEVNFSKLNGKRLIDIVRSYLSIDGTCLDFGAGDGDLVSELIAQGYKCAAYEVSTGRASHISDLDGNERFLGLVSQNRSEEFDVVFLLDVIEHILPESLGNALDLLLSFVKPEGIVIVSTPNDERLQSNYCICPVCRHNFHRWQHLRSIDAGYLEGLFRKWGCEKMATHRVDFSHAISDDEVREIFSIDATRGIGSVDAEKNAEDPALQNNSNKDFRFGNQSHLVYIGKKMV